MEEPSAKVMAVSLGQPRKICSPSSVTVEGMMTSLKKPPKKACSPMDTKPSGSRKVCTSSSAAD